MMTRPSLLLTFSILAAQSKVGRWSKCSRWSWDSLGLQPSSPPPLSTPYCGTTRLQQPPGKTQLPAGAIVPCCLPAWKREHTSKSLSGPNMGQSDKDYVSHLNEQNNMLKPLTSSIVLHHITRQLQCNYRVTEFEQWAYTACGFKAH